MLPSELNQNFCPDAVTAQVPSSAAQSRPLSIITFPFALPPACIHQKDERAQAKRF
jgi:hypothetical protein